MQNSPRKILLISTLSVLVISLFAFPGIFVNAASTTHCQPAGTTGLTALIVAKPHQTISGNVNAKGCDIGVYVGPGVGGVVIKYATITGANDHGILAQNTWNLAVKYDLVTGNGLAPHTCPPPPTPPSGPCIAEDKAVQLVGTINSQVIHNSVKLNFADGGIGVADDGTIDPGALNPGPAHAGDGNLIAYNYVSDNAFGCGIVIAAYNAGEGVAHNVVLKNVIHGSSLKDFANSHKPYVGGIVVAADTPGTSAYGNSVIGNMIKESLIPGIVVHSNAPGDHVVGTLLLNNKITNNGVEAPPNDPTLPTGIEVVAEVPHLAVLRDTWVIGNTVTSDHYGVWTCNSLNTHIIDIDGNAMVPIASCP
ncbi:MAG: right-handed parallel beta-helix repeat-containing protein [archaeon]|nr:right-handed parallel beta-helix repeat-containing protein [archaeon]